jgi:hypothetical protein
MRHWSAPMNHQRVLAPIPTLPNHDNKRGLKLNAGNEGERIGGCAKRTLTRRFQFVQNLLGPESMTKQSQ